MQLIKRLFQSSYLLWCACARQPLLADTACTQRRYGGTPDCYMHLGSMAIPDSAMSSLLASSQATPYAVFAKPVAAMVVLDSIDSGTSLACKRPNIQACQGQYTPHAVPSSPRAPCDSGSEVIRRRGSCAVPGTSSSRSFRIKFSRNSAHMTALGLTGPEACFAPKTELFRRFP